MGVVSLCLLLVMPLQASPASSGNIGTVKDFLTGWQGKWNAVACYTESGGRYTAAWSGAEVVPSTGGGVAFTVKPAAGQPIFEGSLKPTTSNTYVLTVKSAEAAIVDLPMQYSADGGFSGAGTLKNVPVEASIARTEKGYKLLIVDPKLPKDNNYILSFDFFNRKPN